MQYAVAHGDKEQPIGDCDGDRVGERERAQVTHLDFPKMLISAQKVGCAARLRCGGHGQVVAFCLDHQGSRCDHLVRVRAVAEARDVREPNAEQLDIQRHEGVDLGDHGLTRLLDQRPSRPRSTVGGQGRFVGCKEHLT